MRTKSKERATLEPKYLKVHTLNDLTIIFNID